MAGEVVVITLWQYYIVIQVKCLNNVFCYTTFSSLKQHFCFKSHALQIECTTNTLADDISHNIMLSVLQAYGTTAKVN